jgi:hypothetical protein
MPFHSSAAFLVLCLPLVMLAFVLTRSKTSRRDPDTPRSGPELAEDVELLRYENAVLRFEQQRAMSLGKVGERIRDQLGNAVTSGSDEGDDAWGALMEAKVLRDTLLSVCQDLQTAIGHVQLQLNSGIPIPELDRRRNDRGQDAQSVKLPASPTPGDHPANGLLGLHRNHSSLETGS